MKKKSRMHYHMNSLMSNSALATCSLGIAHSVTYCLNRQSKLNILLLTKTLRYNGPFTCDFRQLLELSCYTADENRAYLCKEPTLAGRMPTKEVARAYCSPGASRLSTHTNIYKDPTYHEHSPLMTSGGFRIWEPG